MGLNYMASIMVAMGVFLVFPAVGSPALPSSSHTVGDVKSGDSVKIVLARPLFAPDRRPDVSTSQPELLPVLTGIVHYNGADGALFRVPGIPAGRLARKGDIVGGWTVTVVTREAVTMERARQQVIQRPDFQHHVASSGVDSPSVAGNGE